MHIALFTVRQRPYLRLVESKRRLTRNGKPISDKRLVLSLGPLARHDDGKPDSLARLRLGLPRRLQMSDQAVFVATTTWFCYIENRRFTRRQEAFRVLSCC